MAYSLLILGIRQASTGYASGKDNEVSKYAKNKGYSSFGQAIALQTPGLLRRRTLYQIATQHPGQTIINVPSIRELFKRLNERKSKTLPPFPIPCIVGTSSRPAILVLSAMAYNYNTFGHGSNFIAGTSSGPNQNDAYSWREDENVVPRPGYYYNAQPQRHNWAFPTPNNELFTPMDSDLYQQPYHYGNIDAPPYTSQYSGADNRGLASPAADWVDTRHTSYNRPPAPSAPAQIHINPSEPTPPSHSWDSAVYCCWQVPGPKPGTLVDCGGKFTELEFANHIRRHFERSNPQFTGDGDSKGYCRWKDCNKALKWSSVFRHERFFR
ncbi:hypothetical protein L218DRAFT_1007166 [Marasmius fiardii PR-910]|nr:hypothetical protein L218DRAFT_1007166 [Marasmius fiardii PR-910]